jgi:hypothetical protein
MASNSSGAFDIFVAHRNSVCELQFLNITAGFRYMGVTPSNQNNLHEELHCFGKDEEYIVFGGYRFRFLTDAGCTPGNNGLYCTNICRPFLTILQVFV